ncbi:MAG: hypothetical protein M1170_02280 [Patescibacteria group bacterium]|nr:hypothetical protein [Patescibacteria group bacterium]
MKKIIMIILVALAVALVSGCATGGINSVSISGSITEIKDIKALSVKIVNQGIATPEEVETFKELLINELKNRQIDVVNEAKTVLEVTIKSVERVGGFIDQMLFAPYKGSKGSGGRARCLVSVLVANNNKQLLAFSVDGLPPMMTPFWNKTTKHAFADAANRIVEKIKNVE